MKPQLGLGMVLLGMAFLLGSLIQPKEEGGEVEPERMSVPRVLIGDSTKEEPSYKEVEMVVTAYCTCKVCCEQWSGLNKTSIGDDPRVLDGVAADPKLLPYRTLLEIPTLGFREVDDTGGKMRQDGRRGIYHIDVRMGSHKEARSWGVKHLKVKVYARKSNENLQGGTS